MVKDTTGLFLFLLTSDVHRFYSKENVNSVTSECFKATLWNVLLSPRPDVKLFKV